MNETSNQTNDYSSSSVIQDYTNPERRGPIHQSDIPVGIIKQRHMEPNALLIFTGLAADRPSGESHTKAYFATDTLEFSIWTGSEWKTTTLA